MHSIILCTLAALTTVALAVPVKAERHVLHQKRVDTAAWAKRDRVHGAVKLPIRIGMVQNNLDKGHDLLMDISNPHSPNYTNHLTPEEVVELFAPAQHQIDIIVNWLKRAGVEGHRISQTANKQWIALDLDTWEAELLLNTNYHFYEHRTGKITIGCDQYYVHEDVKDHIDYITPGIRLLAGKKISESEIQKRTFNQEPIQPRPPLLAPVPVSILSEGAASTLSCNTIITPKCIQNMYNFTPATSAVRGNELGIFEALGDYYSKDDLDSFFASVYPSIPNGTRPKLHGVDGGVAPTEVSNAGTESDLDFQISYPIIYPQKQILFQTDDPDYESSYTSDGFFNNFLEAIDGAYCKQEKNNSADPQYPHDSPNGFNHPKQCGLYRPTNVISISYGGQEADIDVGYQKRQCAEYMKLGLQGVSILISSGDAGVAGPSGDGSSNGCLNGGTVFSPVFPATCPYVTAVGATFLPESADPNGEGNHEVATTRFPSGGGFSNIYKQPEYQHRAVGKYLSKHGDKHPSYTQGSFGNGIYNRTGRGYPDVSAVGDNILIYNKGAQSLIGGTSASTPAFAALITRVNDERLRQHKRPVGFLNPAMYAHPQAFNDITTGSNPGCDTTGFDVAKGWDPVTGLGSPNYPALLKLFTSLK